MPVGKRSRTAFPRDCSLTIRASQASGGILFAACMFGWYLLAGLVLPSVDFPIPIPLGDLSGVVPGLSDVMAGAGGGRNPTRRLGLLRRNKPAVVGDASV